ncbi:MAG: NAD-dependent epimerase/dehydratase family protein [Nitrosopumilaceae archaeon]
MKIFVTGGMGFIGHHLVSSLLQEKNKVTIYDNLKNSLNENVTLLKEQGAKFVKGDIDNYKLLLKSITGFDLTIHLAAEIDVQESIRFPEHTHQVNVTGTLNLLRACVAKRVKNVIAPSSAAVYGNQNDLPISENSQTIPISPYGATKLTMEHYLQAFANSYDLNCISLRLFNVYGIGQSDTYAGVITRFMKNIKKKKPLIIFGDGSNTRDFVSIEDVTSAFKKSIKKIEGSKGNAYNIASGKYVSIKELAELMLEISDTKLPILYKKERKGDIKNSQVSIWLAKKYIGYIPKVELRQGLQKLLKI